MPRARNYSSRRTGRHTTRSTRARPVGRKIAAKRSYSRKFAKTRGFARTKNIVFPHQLYQTFTYDSGHFKIAQSVSDTLTLNTYRGNGMYDPQYATGGTQPRWYDTFLGAADGNAPYNRYLCYGSKITVTIFQDPILGGTTGSVMGVVSLLPTMTVADKCDTVKEIMERGFVRYRNVGNANSSGPIVLKHFAKTKSLWMGGGDIASNSDFSATYNNNPSKEWFWQLQIANIIGSGDMSGTNPGIFSCYVNVRIKYYAKLWSLNDVADS